METYHPRIPHEVHIRAFGVVIGVALRVSNAGRVEGYAIKEAMAMETVVNLVRGSGPQDLRIRVV
jgi:hypothetical protein